MKYVPSSNYNHQYRQAPGKTMVIPPYILIGIEPHYEVTYKNSLILHGVFIEVLRQLLRRTVHTYIAQTWYFLQYYVPISAYEEHAV